MKSDVGIEFDFEAEIEIELKLKMNPPTTSHFYHHLQVC